jgi:hypothetical protein
MRALKVALIGLGLALAALSPSSTRGPSTGGRPAAQLSWGGGKHD